jgi:hypothetical protein
MRSAPAAVMHFIKANQVEADSPASNVAWLSCAFVGITDLSCLQCY